MNSQEQTKSINPYVHVSPVPVSGKRPMDKFCEALNRCGRKVEGVSRKAEAFADNVWHHLKVSPSVTDAAMARLAKGAKVLTEGGHDKVFQHEFFTLPGEKLIGAFICYLSISSGPVAGTLYISNKKLAFCSDSPLPPSTTRLHEWMYYKVVVELDNLHAVNPSSNVLNSSEKYIQVITKDAYEFWFMGLISYDKAFQTLRAALPSSSSSFF